MSDYSRLEKALNEGYFVNGHPFSIADIKAGNIDNFMRVFRIGTRKEELLSEANGAKSLIMLEHPSERQLEIITSDGLTIERANKQVAFQNEPVGSFIRARCIALGGATTNEQRFHLKNLVSGLDNLWGWHFKLVDNEDDKFEVEIRLNSIDDTDVKKIVDKLQELLDLIAVLRKIGLQLQYYRTTKVPRHGTYGTWGQEEWMIPALSKEEVTKIEQIISANDKILDAAQGLNHSYIETSIMGRIALLWATSERLFTTTPERLLSVEEIGGVLQAAKNIKTLEKDEKRLKKLEEALRDPMRLSSESRNQRIAKRISEALEQPETEISPRVSEASRVRGKSLHELAGNINELEASEKFLRETLERYVEKALRVSAEYASPKRVQ